MHLSCKATVSSYSFATVVKLQFRNSCEATDSLQLKTQSLYLNQEEDLDSSDFYFFWRIPFLSSPLSLSLSGNQESEDNKEFSYLQINFSFLL